MASVEENWHTSGDSDIANIKHWTSSQEPVDLTDANVMETSTCLETTQRETTVQLLIELASSMFSCTPECSK